MNNTRTCPRCNRSWPDRHSAAATTASLFVFTLMLMMLSTHPIAAGVALTVAGVVGAVWMVERERVRREAVATRAERQYRELLAAPLPEFVRTTGIHDAVTTPLPKTRSPR